VFWGKRLGRGGEAGGQLTCLRIRRDSPRPRRFARALCSLPPHDMRLPRIFHPAALPASSSRHHSICIVPHRRWLSAPSRAPPDAQHILRIWNRLDYYFSTITLYLGYHGNHTLFSHVVFVPHLPCKLLFLKEGHR